MEIFQTVTDWYMNNMNYLTIIILMAIESSFIPFPSEIVIPPAAWKAASGGLNIYLVVISASFGALIGAIVNYYLSLWLGRTIIYNFAESRMGKMCLLSKQKIEHAEAYFIKHGRSSTLIGRLIPGIRQLISIPAGLARMDLKQFVIYTLLGSTIWNIILAALSYFLYSQKELFELYMKELSWVLIFLGFCFVIFLVIKYRKKKE